MSGLPLKLLWRDAKNGELTLLLAAIVVAVTTVTSITLFAEKLQKALVSESNTFLAAELVLRSPDPVPAEWLQSPQAISLRKAEVVQFPSMVFSGEEMFLASVKAVSEDYPLLGKLEISEQSFGEGIKVDTLPAPGEAWLDSRLLHLLNVDLGGEVWVGNKAFVVSAILAREPDSGSSYWSLGPRILIPLSDLKATEVVQAGSRVEYRYLFSGTEAALRECRQFLEPLLEKRHRLMTLEQEQPGLAQSLQRAESFLLLAGSLAVILASIAVAMAAQRYCLRHYDAVALFKVLGSSTRTLKQCLLFPLLVVLFVGVVLGSLLGAGMQYTFLAVMREWLPATLPEGSWRPYGVGAMTAMICVAGFALPLLWRLLEVPPLRVLRREQGVSVAYQASFYLGAVASILLLMWFFSRRLDITLYVFGGTLLAAASIGLLAFLLLGGARQLGTQAGSIWRLGLASLRRNVGHSVLQLVMFSLVFMLLLVSVLIRTSLVKEWQHQLPEGTPNHFLINIAPYQVESVKELLAERQLQTAGLYPMVRGRLSHINNEEAVTLFSEEVDEVYRELNLTWSETLPEDNQLVAGQWWGSGDDEEMGVSVEEGLAQRLNISVGDKLVFSIGSQPLEARVSSIRQLEWDRMRPNFFFIFEPGALEDFPATYITSFFLPSDQKLFLNQLLQQFPTVSIFAVDEMIRRIQKMVDQVTRAIELVLALILSAGILVLIATVQASLDQRIQEAALLRSLGATRSLILGGLAVEFVVLGLISGLMAAACSEVITWCLQRYVFKVDYIFYIWPWLAGPVLGVLVVAGVGVFACRKVVRMPPWRLLRELNA